MGTNSKTTIDIPSENVPKLLIAMAVNGNTDGAEKELKSCIDQAIAWGKSQILDEFEDLECMGEVAKTLRQYGR